MSKATHANYRVPFRRRREGRTNYARRLALIQSHTTRMVIRKTNKSIIVQFIDSSPEGDRTRVGAVSSSLGKLGWVAKRNSATAYLTGLYAGHLAKKNGVETFVLDTGLHTPSNGSILFAAAKGALDAGLQSSYRGDKAPQKKLDAMEGETRKKFDDVKTKIMGMEVPNTPKITQGRS